MRHAASIPELVRPAMQGGTVNTRETINPKRNTTSGMLGHLVDSSTGCELNQREHLLCLIFTFGFHGKTKVGTRSTGAILVAGEALESSAAVQQKHKVYVAAVVSAARRTRPEPGPCRCACVSSINLLKIGTLTAAA